MSFWTYWGLTIVGLGITTFVLILFGALMIFAERRFLGLLQDRLGPNRAGPFGIFQSIADAIKLLAKEDFVPPFADKPLYRLAPVLVPLAALLSFVVVPIGPHWSWAGNLNVGLLFVLAMSSISTYGVFLSGWAANSKYPLLGSLRAIAQIISYELSMGLAVIGVVMLAGSFSLEGIVAAQSIPYIVLQPLGFIIFLLCGIAETNRLPFDLPEAENELGAGYNTEYGGVRFALFFLGEYLGILLIAALTVTLFLSGWRGPLLPGVVWFFLKLIAVVVVFFWLRTSLPRLRYDQLMAFGWKLLLPLALLNALGTALAGIVLL